MRTAAVIAAAGLSSRMGEFKPLMELGGKPMLLHVVDAFLNAGVDTVVVVCGYRAGEIREVLAGRNVHITDNPAYETTDMLASLRLGLQTLEGQFDRVFLNPADAPLLDPSLLQRMMEGSVPLMQTSYQGKGGHPVLMHRSLLSELLAYRGEDGLRGFLQQHREILTFLEAPDEGALLDADTPEEFQRLTNFLKS